MTEVPFDRETLILAALAGFAASREGFNGECAFEHLDPDDDHIKAGLRAPEGGDFVRPVVERALILAGLLP